MCEWRAGGAGLYAISLLYHHGYLQVRVSKYFFLKSTRYFSFHSSSLRVACSCAFLCKKGSFLTTSTRFSPIYVIPPSDESSLSQAFHEFAVGILQNFRRGLMTVMLRLQYSRDDAITLLIFAEHLLDSLVKKRAGSQAENFK